MTQPVQYRTKKRLKGLDEFETPEFVGRMARVARRRRWGWYSMLAIAVIIGAYKLVDELAKGRALERICRV